MLKLYSGVLKSRLAKSLSPMKKCRIPSWPISMRAPVAGSVTDASCRSIAVSFQKLRLFGCVGGGVWVVGLFDLVV